jgi:hypothetical protein
MIGLGANSPLRDGARLVSFLPIMLANEIFGALRLQIS